LKYRFDFGMGNRPARTTSARGVEPEMLEIFGRKNHNTALAVANGEQPNLNRRQVSSG
jgi:hypothetical protein